MTFAALQQMMWNKDLKIGCPLSIVGTSFALMIAGPHQKLPEAAPLASARHDAAINAAPGIV